jgi:xanthine/uracil permease
MAMMSDSRSVPELFSDLVNQLSTLFRKEIQLARAEMSEKVSKALSGVGLIAGGAVILLAALVILLEAAVAGLVAAGLETHWAALIVGSVAVLIGFVLVRAGMGNLKGSSLAPQKTVEQLQRDAAIAREAVR